ncbi:MAG: efflux RND transporter periplasmic adaptor subunit [bacterium]
MKLKHPFLTIILIISSFIISGCSGDSNNSKNGKNRLLPALEVVQAQQGSLPLIERLSGLVKAKNQIEIYPEISAVIKTIHVQNGEEVRKNQPLVSLRDIEFSERLKQAQASYQVYQAEARQAEARLKEIKSELNRTRSLAEKNLTSDAELEAIETRALLAEADVELANAHVEQALATVAEQNQALSLAVIKAPVDGTVGNRNAEIGMTVSPGTRLFTLGQLDNVKVEVILTDRMLNYIEAGQRTEILASNLPSGKLEAPLSRISPFLHPLTHSTEAEIELANPDHYLKSGMFVTVDIFYGESEEATLVPLSALYENPLTGITGVYVSRDTLNLIKSVISETGNKGNLTEPVPFEFIPVKVIAKSRISAGISAIKPGDWIVSLGQDLMGGESGPARARPVEWSWVEHLQNLQREDLLKDILDKKQATDSDTSTSGT